MTGRHVCISDQVWAALAAAYGEHGRARAIRDAIDLTLALRAELGEIADRQDRPLDEVVADAAAAYLAVFRDPVGGELSEIAREQGRQPADVAREAIGDYVVRYRQQRDRPPRRPLTGKQPALSGKR
jgi:hypothetical protein